MNNVPEWMEDPLVADIPKEKLEFLQTMFLAGQGKTQKEMMSSILPLLKQGQSKPLTLSPAEITAAIAAIRNHSSAAENQKIDSILARTGAKERSS